MSDIWVTQLEELIDTRTESGRHVISRCVKGESITLELCEVGFILRQDWDRAAKAVHALPKSARHAQCQDVIRLRESGVLYWEHRSGGQSGERCEICRTIVEVQHAVPG